MNFSASKDSSRHPLEVRPIMLPSDASASSRARPLACLARSKKLCSRGRLTGFIGQDQPVDPCVCARFGTFDERRVG